MQSPGLGAMIKADHRRRQNKNGVLGLGAAVCFMCFVSKFNAAVQRYKDKKNIKKGTAIADGLVSMMVDILRRTCGPREAFTVLKLSSMLLLRTVGSVWVARHWGRLVNATVSRKFSRLRGLAQQFAVVTVGLALLNSLLKYYIATLRLQVRERITLWCHREYMKPGEMIYYKANKVGDDKIENCDHQITSDVDKFSEMYADVLSQSLKPIADFLVYSVELSRVQGLATPITLYVWFAFASAVSTVTLPPFGELAATEQRLEGAFRSKHSELITHSEQIAFLGGEVPELNILNEHFFRLLSHCRHSINLYFNSEVVRQYLNKYFVTVIGLFLIARPLRLGLNNSSSWSPDEIAQYFTSTWKSMEQMASAIQDLFELSNRIGRLSGFAFRLRALMSGLSKRPPVLHKEIKQASRGAFPPRFQHGENLRFQHVTIYKPDGTVLVRDLNFSVERKSRILVTGGNGCGKSSLFRVMRKLWPLVEGTITMPADKEVHFLTQVNFVPVGTLRDLVTYPQSHAEMLVDGRSDVDIHECLEWAHVSPNVVTDGRAGLQFTEEGEIVRPTLDDTRDWQKDLSPGQKQRIAFARLFYHRPSFVVLDECTNGISPDVEHDLYDRCTRLNLAVFSISHKCELRNFHDYELHYKGDVEGSWEMKVCSERSGAITKSVSFVGRPSNSAEGEFNEIEIISRRVQRDRESTPTSGPGRVIACS
uniref:ATP-binding cassette subfamily D member 3 n=2 Tax=Prorocentrum minimum TaxID=39449 RepID=A0A2K8DNY9_PROMN|nr:ATP-binding cassette subfamily D member 3 [Prorocentrum minimum]